MVSLLSMARPKTVGGDKTDPVNAFRLKFLGEDLS